MKRLRIYARCDTDSTMRHFAYALTVDDTEGDYVRFADATAALDRIKRQARAEEDWQPMSKAPQDRSVLVWYDHNADPYQDPNNPGRLTPYATWAESGDFLDGSGFAIARWQPQYWESVDEYGAGYWLPAAWFALENDDFERVVNPIVWKPLNSPGLTILAAAEQEEQEK